MDDYGHIDNDTPSFAFSLYKDYRGFEIVDETGKSTLCFAVCDNTTSGLVGRITAPRVNKLVRNYSLLALFM